MMAVFRTYALACAASLCVVAAATEVCAQEAPETEAPATEAPATEAPETEAPETEAPATEAPETEAPATEAPATEAPETEAAVASAEARPAAATAMRYPPTRTRVPIIAGGLGLTAAAYGLSAGSAAGWPDVPGADMLYVPVVGPWLALGESGCSPDDPGCDAILYLRGVLYVLDGLAQLGGVAIAAEGILMTTEADAAPRARLDANRGATVSFAPLMTAHTAGVSFAGTF